MLIIVQGVRNCSGLLRVNLQALSSGQPVLGCARPSCFGWGEKSDARNMARFYRIHKKNDGFMRKNDLKKYDKVEIAAREPQLAVSLYGSIKSEFAIWISKA
ncbi:unnamed protein product [Gongylonema pulchrum]|uniref:EF-hand domain-containing protein n=1 Tax=Gongylonema pulchrum TaxID=637853 RepID=A0A183D7H5_9BILA|nr:unnamed protein product [Gongylonema pulchrum]